MCRQAWKDEEQNVSTFPFLHKSTKEKPNLLLPSRQRLQKLRFLQKLGCQNPCLDQARLSSLANKQVDRFPKFATDEKPTKSKTFKTK